MVSKSTSILLAVAVVVVGAIAIVGLGYAYTASTDNSGNTSEVSYITLTQDDADYANAFNGSVKYDTKTYYENSQVKTTYTFNTDQLKVLYGNVKGVELGSVIITVAKTGNTDNIKFSVANTSDSGLTGTFYIGIQAGTGAEVIREFNSTQNTENFLKTIAGDDHTAVTDMGQADSTSETTITVKLYCSEMPEPTEGAAIVKPLNGVTFQFKATVPEAPEA